jgi:hypothetical protein
MTALRRTRFQGVVQIVRFNWPFFTVAAGLLLLAFGLGFFVRIPVALRTLVFVPALFGAVWLIASLAVSHYIYDRTHLYEGDWIRKALGRSPPRWATFHAGLDEFSGVIQQAFPKSSGVVADFFDPEEMTERSIVRARNLNSQEAACLRVDFRSLPMRDGEFDALFVFFAAHELREHESRLAFFRELRRVTRAIGGQMILLEHLRDWPNFLAFGPGFLHFHSRTKWLRALSAAGWRVTTQFHFTPFVRAFVLERTDSA